MITQSRKILANLACGPIPRLTDWQARPWLPQTAAYFPSVGQDLQTGYAGKQPKRRVMAFAKRDCFFGGTTIGLPNVPGWKFTVPGSIVQDDQTLQTWYVVSRTGLGRVFNLSPLTPVSPVGNLGNFVVASPVNPPR